MNTTRRYPRTLNDAFRGADYAGPITTPSGRVIAFPSFVRVRRHRLREAWATARLYVALALAWVRGELR